MRKNNIFRSKFNECENYRTLLKEIKGDILRWQVIPHSWIHRLNIANWQYFQIDLQMHYDP